MLSCINRSSRPRLQVLRRAEQHINELYRSLSLRLDEVQEILDHDQDARVRACLTVLEEDLGALLAECEEFMILGRALNPKTVESLVSRSETVLEELQGVLG